MTIAVAQALMDTYPRYLGLQEAAVRRMQEIGRLYPNAGYGGRFNAWLQSKEPKPYHSYGNGAAMRVSACGFLAETIEEAKRLAHGVTRVTHNHPYGMRGAEATAVVVYLARKHRPKGEIRQYIKQHYYALGFTLDDVREKYRFDVSCQGSVPYALEAFLEGEDYEDVIRNAVSIGGDSDTLAAIAGGIAEAFFGIPDAIAGNGREYLDDRLRKMVDDFYARRTPAPNKQGIWYKMKSFLE